MCVYEYLRSLHDTAALGEDHLCQAADAGAELPFQDSLRPHSGPEVELTSGRSPGWSVGKFLDRGGERDGRGLHWCERKHRIVLCSAVSTDAYLAGRPRGSSSGGQITHLVSLSLSVL